MTRSLDQIDGPREARGASGTAVPVHSVRLPSFPVSTEVIFALPDERLTIRHDAGLFGRRHTSRDTCLRSGV